MKTINYRINGATNGRDAHLLFFDSKEALRRDFSLEEMDCYFFDARRLTPQDILENVAETVGLRDRAPSWQDMIEIFSNMAEERPVLICIEHWCVTLMTEEFFVFLLSWEVCALLGKTVRPMYWVFAGLEASQ